MPAPKEPDSPIPDTMIKRGDIGSYNKATAVKLWTDVKTMRTELLDFYGVKMINNTRGVGDILGTRMLKIQTRKIPEHLREEFGGVLPTESARLERLRDGLHTWAFESVGLIESTYRALYPRTSGCCARR